MARMASVSVFCFLTLATGFTIGTGVATAQTTADQPAISPDELQRGAGGPTLITLHLREVSPQLVVDELSRQSGVPIRLWPPVAAPPPPPPPRTAPPPGSAPPSSAPPAKAPAAAPPAVKSPPAAPPPSKAPATGAAPGTASPPAAPPPAAPPITPPPPAAAPPGHEPPPPPKISVDIDRQPFWPALQSLLRKRLFRIAPIPGNHIVLSLVAPSDPPPATSLPGLMNLEGPSIERGPFLIAMSNVRRFESRVIDLAHPGKPFEQSDLVVTGQVFSDPKVPLLPNSTVTLEAALDEKGNDLIREANLGGRSAIPSPYLADLSIPLKVVAGMGARLAKLKGTTTVTAVTKIDRWETPNIMAARDLTHKAGTAADVVTYRIVEARTTDTLYQVTIGIDGPSSEVRRAGQLLAQNTYLVDKENRRFSYLNLSFGGDMRDYKLTLNFARDMPGAPPGSISEAAKLIIEIPVETKQVAIPFEFTNISLQ